MKKSDLSIEFAGLQIIIVQSLVCFLCIFSMCLAGCNQKVIEHCQMDAVALLKLSG